jgi:signal transduction histidine kinase
MRIPRGSASSIISLGAGLVAASALAVAWLPLLQESAQRELELSEAAADLADRLALARVNGETDAQKLEMVRRETGALGLVIRDTTGAVRVHAGVALGACPEEGIRRVAEGRLSCFGLADGSTLGLLQAEEEHLGLGRLRAWALLVGMGAWVALLVIGGIRWLLSPVAELASGARRLAEGARGIHVEPRGHEEIAQLAGAVNALARSLETREDEIQARLDVVNQLLSMVAHEVRNPLQSLSLLASVARGEPDPAARDAVLQSIEEEILGLEGVVRRFLRNSGPLRISRSDCDVVKLLGQAVSLASPEARKRKVSLLVQAPGALPMRGDGTLLRRAMENLLFNAIEFAGQAPPGQVTATLWSTGGVVQLSVDDDGPGIEPADADRIFQPYFSSRPGGTGLGLALCRQVFEAHGGQIRVEGSPMGGARFLASFPLSSPPEGEPLLGRDSTAGRNSGEFNGR